MNNAIHIVCLDAPSPPDYGGAIDMYYKIKALHQIGKNIVLHYFDYKPSRNIKMLEEYCSEIYSYERKSFLKSLPLSRPFIVQSRINKRLIKCLNQDNHPILLEGLHCTGVIAFLNEKERVIVRMHNEEATYYRQLANAEESLSKKIFFTWESGLLNKYQNRLDKSLQMACLSDADKQALEKKYSFRNVHFVPCFLPWQEVNSKEGKGDYCLYHGNLSVAENEEAVLWLIENVFSKVHHPFVVAGKNASSRLLLLTKKHNHIRVINNPPADEMDAIIRDAHIHLLPSKNSTGVKLKILNALLNGRHCITNRNGVLGTGITDGITVRNEAEGWISTIEDLWPKDFTATEIEERKKLLRLYDNTANAQKLNALWTHYQ